MEFSDEIIASLRTALSATPDNAHLHRHLADLLLAHGDPAEAAEAYRQALKLRPADPPTQLGLAESYLRAGKLSAAAVLLDELLKAVTPPPRAWLLQARLLLAQGQSAEARPLYQRALDADPGLQDAELDKALFVQVSQQLQRMQSEEVAPPVRETPLRQAVGAQSAETQAAFDLERPSLGFDDIGGMEAVKEEISIRIIQPLKHPDLFRAYGKQTGGGLLMYGPPGCGKTHLARATAGEVQAAFLSVGINEILEMWLGQSERNLHAIFEQARSLAPCVLFFDEVDALGASRSDMRQSAGRQLINQFLLELDGVQGNNEGLLILAATNAPWHLDTAFRRPGRFDRLLFVPPPDEPGRAAVLNIHLAGKPTETLDTLALAKKTPGFSGADLRALVEQAIEDKLREALKSGAPEPLRQKDLLKALKRVKPTTREWFTTARNYALYANQSGFYDDILHYLNLQ
ncbi:MAG: AAA family ATPase [Candidatus Sericytochromatia bacterium]